VDWSISAFHNSLATPAGTFPDVFQIRFHALAEALGESVEIDASIYLARGVGVVRLVDHDENETENLVSGEVCGMPIQATQPLEASVESVTGPSTLPIGGIGTASVRVRNAGTTTWRPEDGFALAVVADACAMTPYSRVGFAPGESVAPGEVHEFSIPIAAPLTPGPCRVEFQMIQEFIAIFGQIAAADVEIVPDDFDDAFLASFDFRNPANSASWLSGALPGFGGSAFQSPQNGLCLQVSGPGDNLALWRSPSGLLPLVDGQVYRIRIRLDTDQLNPDAIPLFFFFYSNQQPDFFQNFGGERWLWTASGMGGAMFEFFNSEFEVFFAPPAIDLPQWRTSNDAGSAAFDPEADARNDMQIAFRIIDVVGAADALGASGDEGTICVESIRVSTIPLATIRAAATTVYAPPLNDGSDVFGVEDVDSLLRTHFPQSDAFAAAFPNVVADVADGEWNVQLSGIDAASDPLGLGFIAASLGPDVVAGGPRVIDGFLNPLRLFPIVWSEDGLYMVRAAMRSNVAGAVEGVDPVDVIQISHQTLTAEKGGQDYATRGADLNGAAAGDGGGMLFAGSPRLPETIGGPTPEYISFFSGFGSTFSFILNAAQWKAQVDLFNRGDLEGLSSGRDPLTLENLIVDRIDGLNLSGN
jgi:hypothetical protein